MKYLLAGLWALYFLATLAHASDEVTLAVKNVVYRDSTDAPVMSEREAEGVIDHVNSVWKSCGVRFALERFETVKPGDLGLRYQIANYTELTDIRHRFASDRELLIVTTGTWDRSGSLGNSGANAWTTLPGSAPYGAVIERPVGDNGNLIAHELGHYLNLMHAGDGSDLMNPVIYSRSKTIPPDQCRIARATALGQWSKALRPALLDGHPIQEASLTRAKRNLAASTN